MMKKLLFIAVSCVLLSSCALFQEALIQSEEVLTNLEIQGKEISPAFTPEVKTYTAELPTRDRLFYIRAVPYLSTDTPTFEIRPAAAGVINPVTFGGWVPVQINGYYPGATIVISAGGWPSTQQYNLNVRFF
ncbi:MAG: hypothetical protein Nk1A_8390 [Endomicrobiia bacterium]|nr:MAG: hypothetical protein Nk1A_8390 [Endomicrobiia bacterium]